MLGSGDSDVVQLDTGKGMMCWWRAAPAAVTLRRTGFSAPEKTKSKTKRATTLGLLEQGGACRDTEGTVCHPHAAALC